MQIDYYQLKNFFWLTNADVELAIIIVVACEEGPVRVSAFTITVAELSSRHFAAPRNLVAIGA
jgi:hypothetical protein